MPHRYGNSIAAAEACGEQTRAVPRYQRMYVAEQGLVESARRGLVGWSGQYGGFNTNYAISRPTHVFNGPFPGLPGSAGTRKVKPIWILLKQETVSGSGICHARQYAADSRET